jgi:hypothetical protein
MHSSFGELFPTITISRLNVIVAFDRSGIGAFLAIVRIVGNGLAVNQPKTDAVSVYGFSCAPLWLANASRGSAICAKEETR